MPADRIDASGGPTEAQRQFLTALVAQGGTADRARLLSSKLTHDACRRRGWIVDDFHAMPNRLIFRITDAGREALRHAS